MSIQAAILRNRRRQAELRTARRLIHNIRLNWFDYEDAGKAAKADRIIMRLQKRLEPKP